MAPPRRKRRKATLHSAGRATEADLLEAARALSEDPSLATVECDGACVLFSPVKASRRGVQRAFEHRDDEKTLAKLASGGNELSRAYASCLLVAKAGKIPFVGDLKLPTGNIPYVARGKAKPLFVAGLLHHEDRATRLLAVATWTKKRGLHFYSANRGIVCTGRHDRPPADFVQEELEALALTPRDGAWACPHDVGDRLVLRWRNAGVEVVRCAECLDPVSTLARLLRHMSIPRAPRAFEVTARLTPLRGVPVDVDAPLPADAHDAYLRGGLSDAQLLDRAREARVAALKARPGRLFVAGDESFGDDRAAFLAALSPAPAERRALEAAMEAHEGSVVLDRASPARAIAELWPVAGRRMLEAAASHAPTAEALYKDLVTSEEAAELVRRAGREGSARRAGESLPRYTNLPPAAETADAIARAHRAEGPDAAARLAVERAAGRTKGVALAFLRALQSAKGHEWRFAREDHEVADVLEPHAKRLLDASGEAYHAALRDLSVLAGETRDFAPR